MRLLDLFAGIGGFSLAAHWMGWQTVAFVERDKFCQKVLRKNFGNDIEIHDDICEFDGRPFRGTVDIITGGFPCQPFSAAGKRKGRDDERHLFPQMLRVIREVRPLWVVAENVRGLLSIESGQVFADVITSLEGEGYEVITFCIPASALSAPHRRDRLWIVAHHLKYAEHNGQLARQTCRSDHTANGKEPFRQVATIDDAGTDGDAADASNNGWRDRGKHGELDSPTRTESRRRPNRLKALGNSIVPQIAFEIFRAIRDK